jgi:DNA-binding transcriptional LysR family regulator
MELRHLRYFVAVAEEKHFGRAAKRLHIAQPPLSRQIQRLEAELGFTLLDRTRRRVELTAAGKVLLAHARAALEALELGVHEAHRASLGEHGRVAVGYPSSLAYSGLTGLLRAFRLRFPDVELGLRELSPGEQIEAIRLGQLDVGFVRGPLHEPSLVSERVRRESLVLVLPTDHPLAQKKTVSLSAVANEPFVLFPRRRGPTFYDLLIRLCESAGFTPRIVQEAPQVDVLSLVAAGFGVSIVPSSVRELGRHDVALCGINGAPDTELLIVWRAGDGSPALRAFVDTVRRVGLHSTQRRRR